VGAPDEREMATYFERMRAGMQQVQGLLLEHWPEAEFEWGPMDNDGNYPFLLRQERGKVLLYRFSKDSLVSVCDEPHRSKVRTLLRQAVAAYQPS